MVLQAYKNEGLLPPTVVVHMGTNGAFSDAQFDQMMAVLGKRTVFFVNAREPRTWETEVNERLAADVKKYPNAHLIDWHDSSQPARRTGSSRRHPPHRRRRRAATRCSSASTSQAGR